MELENNLGTLKHPLDFLKESDVQDEFADLNIELLRGRHVQDDSFYWFNLLDKYIEELKHYYLTFYGLLLERKSFDGATYFYLSFNDNSKGVLSSNKRHKELSPIETITAITLLNIYYEYLFEKDKEITYKEIKDKIEKSEHSETFKKAFFKGLVKDNYSTAEWANVFKNIKNVINDFDQLGWVAKIPIDDEKNFKFKIKQSIHRFYLLYEKEINNLDEFIDNYLKDRND